MEEIKFALAKEILSAMGSIEEMDIKHLKLTWWSNRKITSIIQMNDYLFFRYNSGINVCDYRHLTDDQIKTIHEHVTKDSHFEDLFDDLNFFA